MFEVNSAIMFKELIPIMEGYAFTMPDGACGQEV